MSLLWYNQEEAGVDEPELFDLLRRHGFVEGAYRALDTETKRRVDELASELFEEITASEGERRYAAECLERLQEESA